MSIFTVIVACVGAVVVTALGLAMLFAVILGIQALLTAVLNRWRIFGSYYCVECHTWNKTLRDVKSEFGPQTFLCPECKALKWTDWSHEPFSTVDNGI